MNSHAFWIGADFDGAEGAVLALASDRAQHPRLDALMLNLYESDPVWYLSQQDGHCTLEADPARVHLCDNDGALLGYPVDDAWLTKARDDGAILLIFTHEDPPDALRALSPDALVDARDDGELELIVAIGPPSNEDSVPVG